MPSIVDRSVEVLVDAAVPLIDDVHKQVTAALHMSNATLSAILAAVEADPEIKSDPRVVSEVTKIIASYTRIAEVAGTGLEISSQLLDLEVTPVEEASDDTAALPAPVPVPIPTPAPTPVPAADPKPPLPGTEKGEPPNIGNVPESWNSRVSPGSPEIPESFRYGTRLIVPEGRDLSTVPPDEITTIVVDKASCVLHFGGSYMEIEGSRYISALNAVILFAGHGFFSRGDTRPIYEAQDRSLPENFGNNLGVLNRRFYELTETKLIGSNGKASRHRQYMVNPNIVFVDSESEESTSPPKV